MNAPTPKLAKRKKLVAVKVNLVAKTNKQGLVYIKGPRTKKTLNKGDPKQSFEFTLTDTTGLGVQFVGLDTEDDWPVCPPPGGQNSAQITDVVIGATAASFADRNSNTGGPMDVCYCWNFACTQDPAQHPKFDPIISNGGR